MATVRHLRPFPWCVPHSTAEMVARVNARSGADYGFLNLVVQSGAGSLWPISVTLEDAMKFYWRVKNFRVTTACENISVVGPAHQGAINEKNLVCFPPWPVETNVEEQNLGTVFRNASLSITWEFLIYDPDTQLFRLPLVVTFVNNAGDTSETETGSTSYWTEAGPDNIQKGSIDFLGYTLPMGGGVDFSYGAGTVEAVEYWPYDPGDGGGPIYDSATGAQLRPFPA
jgi:hypothetical protein